MYYVPHLSLPAIVALVMAIAGTQFEWSLLWFEHTAGKIAGFYLMFALPHWIWAAVSSHFEAAKGASAGGFIGLHLLLFFVWLLVAQSSEPHAANGWFIYFLGAPIVIGIGAVAGRYVASWKTRQSA